MALTKVSYSMITGAPINVLDLGVDSSGASDCTALVQSAIGSSKTIVFPPGQYLFSGNVDNILVNVDNIEFVFEAGAELIKTGTGAMFYVGSLAGTHQNIQFTGAGTLKNPITKYNLEATAIKVGASGNVVDGLVVDGLTIRMSKYGIVSGATDASIINARVTNNQVFVDMDGWASGVQVAQCMNFNLPGAAIKPSGLVANNRFELTNNVSTKGDAYKWTNFTGIFDGNHCIVFGGAQTVGVFSSCENFSITDSVFETSSSVPEDAVQINTAGSGNGVVSNIVALAGSGSESVQLGNMTAVTVSNIRANRAIRQTAGTTMTACDIQGFAAESLDMSAGGSNFVGGSITDGRLDGQAYIVANESDIRDLMININGASTRGLFIGGDDNKINGLSVRDTTNAGIEVNGSDNIIDDVVLTNCSSAWQVNNGSANTKFGTFTFLSPAGTTYLDNGTNTAYPNLVFTGLSGSVTLPVPSNPTGFTKVRLVGGSGNTTITDLTGAADGDRVVLLVTDSTYSYTFTRTNAFLSGGSNWVGGRYDSLSLIYDDTDTGWYELARSANS
jgi:hypothetical protein